jgi:hypothetical protein
VRELHLVPPPGVLGVATGAIAIGTAATSTSTTTIILTETPTETLTEGKLARETAGSITRNIGEMLPMATGRRRISSVAMPASSLGAELGVGAASGEPVVRVGLVELAA